MPAFRSSTGPVEDIAVEHPALLTSAEATGEVDRLAFESWAKQDPLVLLYELDFTRTFPGSVRDAGRYVEGATELCWCAWKARGLIRQHIDERHEFEVWTVNGGNRLTHVFSVTRSPNGTYLHSTTELCWHAWQARGLNLQNMSA